MSEDTCPFCSVAAERVILETDHAFTIFDGYPVSPGHVLIVPKRHVAGWFETTTEERLEILELIDAAKLEIEKEHSPDGWNIGINDGASAGQTVFHLHVHLIPRYEGDLEDPRGGVRWVLAEKARYWGD